MSTWSVRDIPDLKGCTVIVTGASAGLGKATARFLAGRGARVIMACRNEAKARQARDDIADTGVDPRLMTIRRVDLGDQGSVRRFADDVLGEHGSLDLLINNAGLSVGTYAKTADGFETQFGVNHLGHFALTLRLLPALAATPGARIVTQTSGAHRFGRIRLDDPSFDTGGYRAFPAYAQSKLANLLFSAELGRRLRTAGHDTISISAEPGFARTELGAKDSTSPSRRAMVRISYLIIPSQSADAGAGPVLRAATDPDATSGRLYGPRMGTRGAPVEKKPGHRATRDPLVAARLWDLSLDLTSMDSPAILAPAQAQGNTD
jgi:protochlorophyllide reductase